MCPPRVKPGPHERLRLSPGYTQQRKSMPVMSENGGKAEVVCGSAYGKV